MCTSWVARHYSSHIKIYGALCEHLRIGTFDMSVLVILFATSWTLKNNNIDAVWWLARVEKKGIFWIFNFRKMKKKLSAPKNFFVLLKVYARVCCTYLATYHAETPHTDRQVVFILFEYYDTIHAQRVVQRILGVAWGCACVKHLFRSIKL